VTLRCVIVDDDPGFLRSARALLEQEGFRVVGVASTPADALERVQALRPDVTLLDVNLGPHSGFEVARRLSGSPERYRGDVVLISVYARDDLAELMEASPAIGFLTKSALSAAAIAELVRARAEGGDAAP
jgi:DNA-binding NarL/FixJ family response regulator